MSTESLTHRVLHAATRAGAASPARNAGGLKRRGAIKAKEAAQPMGEALLYPDVEPEVLQARVPGRGVEGSTEGSGAEPSRTVEMLAEEERGTEVRAAAEGARGAAEAEQDVYGEEVQGAQVAHLEAVAEAEQESAEAQKAEREKAQDEVRGARGAWAGEQDAALLEKDEEASLELKEAAEEIQEEKQAGEEQAAEEIQEGNEAARVAQEQGEQEAETEKQKGERESEGFFGWVASKAKTFLARVQKAISQALERARSLIYSVPCGGRRGSCSHAEDAKSEKSDFLFKDGLLEVRQEIHVRAQRARQGVQPGSAAGEPSYFPNFAAMASYRASTA